MTEENRNVPADGSHSSGISLPDGAADKSPRKINPVPAVHTTGGDGEIKLPETKADIITDTGAQRFIKTGSAPRVTLHAEEKSDTDVEKYTDRLSARPQQRMRTGYTGKIRTYDDNHSAPSEHTKRMIMPDPSESEMRRGTEQTAKEADGFEFDSESLELDEASKKAAEAASSDENTDLSETSGARADGETSEKTANGGAADADDGADDRPTKKLPEKGELLREIAGTATDDVPHDPDQMMMDGYGGDGGDGSREEALRKTRAKKISSFHFWGKEHTQTSDGSADEKFTSGGGRELPGALQRAADRFSGLASSFTPVKGDEYGNAESRKAVFGRLIKTRNGCLFRAAAVALAGIILLIIDLSVSLSASNNGGFFAVLGGNSLVYNIINSVFLAGAAAVMFPDLKAGAASLLKVQPKADTSLLVTFVFAAVQNISMYNASLKTEYDLHLLTPAVLLLSVPYLAAKLFFYDSTRQCFKAVSAKSEKFYLRRVSDTLLVREMLRDSDADESINVVYAGKTKFISAFLSRSADSAAAAMPASRLVLICAGMSAVLGIIALIKGKSLAAGATAATLASLCSFPVGSLLFLGKRLADENKKLSLKSSFVQSYADARDFSYVDDIVIDDTDVIKAEVVKCISAKDVKEKQAMFVAGVLTSVSGGLLKQAFAPGIAGFEERLPAADGLVYEDRLGVSAWISGCKILLGTHALLANHNVAVPEERIVNTLIEDGCKPVYLAIEGRFAALFSVKYTPLEGVADNLRQLADNGANILISTVDGDITDAYAERLLDLPADSVRTLQKKVTDKLSSSRTAVTDSEEAGIVFGDSVTSLCRCAAAAIRLDSEKRISKLICTGASALGLIITALLVLTGAYAKVSSAVPAVLQLIWIAFCFVSPLLFGNLSKPRVRKALKKSAPDENGGMPYGEMLSDRFSDADSAANVPTDARYDKNVGNENKNGDGTDNNTAASGEGSDGDDPISKETYSALDVFADDQEKYERRKNRGKRAAKAAADGDTSAVSEEMSEEDSDSQPKPFAEAAAKLKNVFAGVISREPYRDGDITEDADETASDGEEAPATPEKRAGRQRTKRETDAPAPRRKGILIPDGTAAPRRKAKDTYSTANEIEAEYKRKKDEDERMRSIFTAPEMPAAPHYELGEKPQEKARFVPPTNVGSVNVFDDSVFSPFEDDKIFAGLHDTESEKYDF